MWMMQFLFYRFHWINTLMPYTCLFPLFVFFKFYFPLDIGILIITDLTSPKEHYFYFLVENALVPRKRLSR